MKKALWACLCVLVCAGIVFATGTGESKQKVGGTVRFIAFNDSWTTFATEKLIPEFEKATGIKVVWESFTDEQQSQKVQVESAGGSTTLDVFAIRPLQELIQYEKNGWFEPLEPYAKADPTFDLADFSPVTLGATSVKGKLVGIPLFPEATFMFYNKQLLSAKGLKPPTTMDELWAAAEKLTDKSKGIYGYGSRGARAAAVTQFSPFLYAFGGDFITNGKASIDTPAAIKAFKFYGDILRNFGPPGVQNMAAPPLADLFAQGNLAIAIEASSSWYSQLVDPARSKVWDQVGVTLSPAGPAGAKPYSIIAWALCIGKNSKQKDLAWKLISWLTSKDSMARAMRDGNIMSRKSVWEDPANTTKFTPEFAYVTKTSALIGVPYDRPVMINVQQARDIIGAVIVTAIEGGNVESAAHDAQAKFQALLDEEK